MSKQKLTEWFDADVKPARIGVYQKDYGLNSTQYQYWNGKRWIFGSSSIYFTFQNRRKNTGVPIPRKWRGLAEKP